MVDYEHLLKQVQCLGGGQVVVAVLEDFEVYFGVVGFEGLFEFGVRFEPVLFDVVVDVGAAHEFHDLLELVDVVLALEEDGLFEDLARGTATMAANQHPTDQISRE